MLISLKELSGGRNTTEEAATSSTGAGDQTRHLLSI
jgi:hypothetical protein